MAKYMTPRLARARVIADEHAPVRLRLRALKEIEHPPLTMLRRLIADTTTRTKPVPSRLRALALMRYVQEVEYRKIKTGKPTKTSVPPNALGIQ